MDKYINADKLLADNNELADCDFNHPKYEETLRDIIDRAQTEDVIPLNQVKQAREEIADRIDNYPDRNISEYEDCLAILDKLIAEYMPAKSDSDLQEEQEEER